MQDMARSGVTITWLGHAGFHVSPDGEGPAFLFDPWLNHPKVPGNARELVGAARLILLTHGHFDHIDSVAEIATGSRATVLSSDEVSQELAAEGVASEQLVGFNIGGSTEVEGVRVTLVQAHHSSSRRGVDGRPRDVGNPCGMVVELPDGPVIYNTGDTGVFGDMALIAELYRPTVLFLPIGDFYTMGPRQAAKAVELVNPEWIVPQHYDTFPLLHGTLAAFRDAVAPRYRERILAAEPGKAFG
jgi:L-ascorbate metabolism protein UlaG (beta-lactamase superfamily)